MLDAKGDVGSGKLESGRDGTGIKESNEKGRQRREVKWRSRVTCQQFLPCSHLGQRDLLVCLPSPFLRADYRRDRPEDFGWAPGRSLISC